MKLTQNAIISEASIDSTESSRTRMALLSCLKLRQWRQDFVPLHLQLSARGHQGRGINSDEAFPSDRHIYVLLASNIPSSGRIGLVQRTWTEQHRVHYRQVRVSTWSLLFSIPLFPFDRKEPSSKAISSSLKLSITIQYSHYQIYQRCKCLPHQWISYYWNKGSVLLTLPGNIVG